MFRRNRSRHLWLIVLAVLAFAMPAAAQDGSAQGKITDAMGQPVAGAKITIEFIGSGRKFETKSEKDGTYLQVGLIQGQYMITAEKDGVGKVTRTVMIRGARRNNIDVVIAAGAGAATADPKLIEANKIINEGVTLSQAGSQDEAIAKFNEALALNPKCFDCFFNIGAASAQKKDYDKAIEAYNKSIEIKPTRRGLQRPRERLQRPAQVRRCDRGQQEGHRIGVGGGWPNRQPGSHVQPGRDPLQPGQGGGRQTAV